MKCLGWTEVGEKGRESKKDIYNWREEGGVKEWKREKVYVREKEREKVSDKPKIKDRFSGKRREGHG